MATFDARLATRITGDVQRRLKLAAAVAGTSISATLTEVLDKALPTRAELADRLQQTGSGDWRAEKLRDATGSAA